MSDSGPRCALPISLGKKPCVYVCHIQHRLRDICMEACTTTKLSSASHLDEEYRAITSHSTQNILVLTAGDCCLAHRV